MLDQLERILGNIWVTIAAFIIGPTILYLQYRRRRRLNELAKGPAKAAAAPEKPPKAAPAPAAAAPPPDAGGRKALWPGFRGLKWGQPPAEGMAVVHEEGETRFLTRPLDELRIGNVHVTSVVYSFRIDRLEAVIVDLPLAGFELLVRHLTSEWGPPKSSPDRNKHVWADPGTGPDASQAVLEKKVENRTAKLVLSSRAAHAERAKTRPGA